MLSSNENLGLAQETLNFLAEVKKGKVRRFLMVAKGQRVVSLLVYKKGSFEALKKEAKEAGKGQVYFGLVEGNGLNILFQLAVADGFTEPPVKKGVMKAFLADGGFPCKPEFQIVAELPSLQVEDEEEGELDPHREAIAPSTSTDIHEARSINEGSDHRKKQIAAAVAKLTPALKKAIELAPQFREELITAVGILKKMLGEGDYNEAEQNLSILGKRILQILNTHGEPKESSASSNLAVMSDQWRTLRAQVIASLKILAKQIAATRSPLAAGSIIELKAVIANLSESPDLNQIDELVRYLSDDQVVKDIAKLAFDFRKPMLETLSRWRRLLTT